MLQLIPRSQGHVGLVWKVQIRPADSRRAGKGDQLSPCRKVDEHLRNASFVSFVKRQIFYFSRALFVTCAVHYKRTMQLFAPHYARTNIHILHIKKKKKLSLTMILHVKCLFTIFHLSGSEWPAGLLRPAGLRGPCQSGVSAFQLLNLTFSPVLFWQYRYWRILSRFPLEHFFYLSLV